MANKFFKSFFAVAIVLGSALGFVACEDKEEIVNNPTVALSTSTLNFSNEEGSQTVEISANSDWSVENTNDWVTVTPMQGTKNGTITVAVSMNDTGAVRTAVINVYSVHKTMGKWETKKLTVQQSASEAPTVEEKLLYSDNFDGKEATKTYGSGPSWPYIDQFPEFANPEGDAAANVTYSGSGVSVRANSASDSDYSDYAGSGMNNIFFGGGAYFVVNDIAPLEGVNFKITFGTEKYSQDGDSTFNTEELLMYISKDGEKWAPVEYTYAGTEPGRWNVATANFTLAAATEKLYIKFEAKVASVYRIDDLKFYVGNGGQTIDLDNIQEPEPPAPPTTDALYFENFDGKAAVKDGNYWPYVTDFPEMKNAAGSAAENVSYDGHNTTVRNNSNSDGTYSDYEGSGVNNIFFGKVENYFIIKDLALESSQKDLVLTFGTEKYSQSLGSLFKNEEFIVSLSGDGQKWTAIEYTFAGTAEGRWNVATANFTLKEVPAKLYIKFSATAESAYRLDDVTLNVGEGGQEVDLATGTAPEPTPEPGDAVKATVAEFLAAAEDSTIYELTGEITNVANTTYGNFDLTDATGTVYIYGLSSPSGEQKYWAESGAKLGDTITVRTVRSSYNGTAQGKDAIFVSLVPGEGGGDNPDQPNVPADGIYESDSAFVCTTDDSANSAYGHKDTKIGVEAVTGFKLGTGSKSGYFKSGAVGVDGDKYLNFYAVAWKGKSATLYIRVNGGEAMSFDLNPHDGATGNAPYTALTGEQADHYSVKIEGLTAASYFEFSTDASFTAVANDASGRAIVFGMKLTDEPIGTETPGGGEDPEPEPTPGDVKTIAEALAVGQGNTIGGVIEGVVVSNLDLNNLTSKKAMYVQDETGALQFYLAANHEFAFGTKLRIDLSAATLGEYNGAVQVSGLALDKIEVISTGNAVTPKTVSMTDFLANKYEGQYIALEGVQVADADLSKTWGDPNGQNHVSINMEDANGNTFVVFSSKYASYKSQSVAQGSGTIKGISSISKGAMQIIFAQTSDFAGLTGDRFGDNGGEEPTPDPEPEQPSGNSATISFADRANRTSCTTQQQVWEQNGVIVTNDKGASSTDVNAEYYNPARFYKDSKLTVAVESGEMATIVFHCNDYKAEYTTALQSSISGAEVTIDGTDVTAKLNATTKSFVIDQLTAQVRVNSITVYYAE